jgi:hypothetical protein
MTASIGKLRVTSRSSLPANSTVTCRSPKVMRRNWLTVIDSFTQLVPMTLKISRSGG